MHHTMMESTVESHEALHHEGLPSHHDDSMMASSGVEHQGQLALSHHHFGGGGGQHQSHDSEGWTDMNQYHQNAMADYVGFGYSAHGLPSESIQRMPPPPPPLQPLQPLQPMQSQQQQHQHHQHHQSHPPLPMLTIPQQQATWPSMLTNPSGGYSSHSAPPISMPSLMSPSPGRAMPARPPPSQPRKTLTDEDRRKMCEVHQANPSMKQTEIGNMFGVERSTVSKVLRRKETFLHKTDDRSQSPIKRSKGKLPDIDKAMSIWVRKQQQIGVEISDEELLHQARHFAVNTGGGDDSLLKVLNRTWVDKFKQKNGVGMPRLLRRASETNIPTGHVKMSTASSPALGHGVISPTSPAGDATATAASPTSADRSDEETAQHGLGFLSYPSEGGGFRRSASQSVTSLNTALSADAATGGTMSAATLSPARSFHFSPDPNAGAFITAGAGSNFQRPRSQTFPTLDMEYMNQQQQNSTESTPRVLPPASTAPTSALDSPTHELTQGVFGIASPHLRHSSSNSSMAGRSTSDHVASGMSSTPAGSTPTSPTQEDARRAVDTLLSFINNSGQGVFVDHNDYNTLLRLTDKLRLHQSQMAKVAGLGGLSRIPEGDVEMVHTGSATP